MICREHCSEQTSCNVEDVFLFVLSTNGKNGIYSVGNFLYEIKSLYYYSALKTKNGDNGLPISTYKIYNIVNNYLENLLDFVRILSEEPVRANVLSKHSISLRKQSQTIMIINLIEFVEVLNLFKIN